VISYSPLCPYPSSGKDRKGSLMRGGKTLLLFHRWEYFAAPIFCITPDLFLISDAVGCMYQHRPVIFSIFLSSVFSVGSKPYQFLQRLFYFIVIERLKH